MIYGAVLCQPLMIYYEADYLVIVLCLYGAPIGGQEASKPPHTLLPSPLWDSSVQQSSLEQLEPAEAATAHHHGQQLPGSPGQVRHQLDLLFFSC